MSIRFALALVLVAGAPASLLADLKSALAEPNLEKRSKLALDNATAALDAARSAYTNGDNEKMAADITELQQSVDLAYKSLQDTGKNPRKSSRWFKAAEIRTRDLLRRLDAFEHDMSFEDRPPVEKAKTDIQSVHDDLLVGLMEGKLK
jgi:hypothetical protein